MATRTSPEHAAGRPRRQPQRRCVGCRRTGDQHSFVRLVRNASGRIVIDERGREPGRGAYLCPAVSCWQRGIAGALAGAFRAPIAEADRSDLRTYALRFTEPAVALTIEEGWQA